MLLYLGSPSAVHRHWRSRVDALDAASRQASRVVLADERLMPILQARVPNAPDMLTMSQWLNQTLPQHITHAPVGTWEFLSALVPDSLLSEADRQTPGFSMSLAETVRAGRSLGHKAVQRSPDDRVPWSQLFQWFDAQFRGPLADGLRMYEYASISGKVPSGPAGIVMVYGFPVFSAPLVKLLAHWDQQTSVEVWALAGLDEEGVDAMIAAGAQPSPVPDEAPSGFRILVRPDIGVDAADVASKVVMEQPEMLRRGVVAAGESLSRKTWLRALHRRGLATEEDVLENRDAALWNVFRSLIDRTGTPNPYVLRRWLEEVSVGVGWLGGWRTRLETAQSWAEVAALWKEARDVHQAEWDFVSQWAEGAALWDHFAPPDWGRIVAAMRALSPRESEDRLVLPLDLAVWVPANQAVMASQVGRGSRANPFRRDQAIRLWLHRTEAAWLDRRILKIWLSDPGQSLWLIGAQLPFQAHGLEFEERLAGTDMPIRTEGAASLHNWYSAWRESGGHSAHSGKVSAGMVDQLMPAKLSPSALEDFGRCPLNFLMARILRIETVEEDAWEVSPSQTGQWAHQTLELMISRKLTLTSDHVRQCVREAMGAHPPSPSVPAVYRTYQEDRLCSELYEALLRDRWSPELRSEVEVFLNWEWVWPMQGRLDRLDWAGNGVRLVDYKTGRMANPAKPSPANMQLLLYQKAVSDRYGLPVTAELYGVSQKSQFRHERLLPEEAEMYWDEVDAIGHGMAERMAAGEFFPVPDPRLDPCRMCSFQLVCPSRVTEYAEAQHQQHPEYLALWHPGEELGPE